MAGPLYSRQWLQLIMYLIGIPPNWKIGIVNGLKHVMCRGAKGKGETQNRWYLFLLTFWRNFIQNFKVFYTFQLLPTGANILPYIDGFRWNTTNHHFFEKLIFLYFIQECSRILSAYLMRNNGTQKSVGTYFWILKSNNLYLNRWSGNITLFCLLWNTNTFFLNRVLPL